MSDFEQRVLSDSYAGRKLAKNWNLSLEEFLSQEISAVSPADDGNAYFQIVIDAMRHRADSDNSQLIARTFPKFPVLQMADGAHLLTDPEVYLNNTVMRLAQLDTGAEAVISQQCSTISCVTNALQKQGPAFAHWNDNVYQVFDAPNKTLRHTTPATLRHADVRLASIDDNTTIPINALQGFLGESFPSGSQAILAMNRELWPHDTPLILYDEELTVDVVASAIEKTGLGDELTDPESLATLKRAKAAAISHPHNLTLRDSTDFFYGVSQKGRLTPLVARSNQLVTRIGGETVVDLNTRALSEALRNRLVYPDLTLAYACLCLRSGIVAAGGLSQQEYLPRIAEVFQGTEEQGVEAGILVGGIVELTSQHKRLAQESLVDPASRHRLDRLLATASIRQLVGDMSNFEYFQHLYTRRDSEVRTSNGKEIPTGLLVD